MRQEDKMNRSTNESKRLSKVIPRSNSTSDLYIVPTADNGSSPLKKRYKRSSSLPNNAIRQTIKSQELKVVYPRGKRINSHQSQRILMKSSFNFPNGESFTPKDQMSTILDKQDGRGSNSLPPVSGFSFSPSIDRTFSNSPTSSKSSEDVNSMKNFDMNDSDSTTISDVEDGETITFNNNTLKITKKDNINIPKRPTLTKEPQDISPKRKLPNKKSIGIKFQTTGENKHKPGKSRTGLSSLFKKFLTISTPKEPVILKNEVVKEHRPEELQKLDLTLLDEEEDDNTKEANECLMDTEFIFNDILSKVDENDSNLELASLIAKGSEYQTDDETTMEETSLDDSKEEQQLEQEDSDILDFKKDLYKIDYEIIEDFAKLGDAINLVAPPRSIRRPNISNTEQARKFYYAINEVDEFMKRISQKWENVVVDEVPKSTNFTNSAEKKLKFSNDVYVTNTYTVHEYQRCDINYLETKTQMVSDSTGDFVNSLKIELNEYKRTEMIIHVDSIDNTHFYDD